MPFDDLEYIFSLASTAALGGWVVLAILGLWGRTAGVAQWGAGALVPLLLSLAYAVLLVPGLGDTPEGGSFSTLAGVKALFSSDQALLVGWIHYLAFDLFVGAWEARDARRLGIPHLLILPCLFLTLMFGPVGLVVYFALRTVYTRRLAPLA